ncbi:hypothetical protein [Nocardia sp. NBC_01388]|uniref:hypothetical protein n=1 Tax=Nocardia sp. NBC_01388 TaxID=2903596 RepID=UPI0032546EB2
MRTGPSDATTGLTAYVLSMLDQPEAVAAAISAFLTGKPIETLSGLDELSQ